MISVGLKPHVRVDETAEEEKQDLLSLDMYHQYKIWCPFRDMRDTDANKYQLLALVIF